MTYRDLVEICYKTPAEECCECSYKNECKAFITKTDGKMPAALYKALGIDFDGEISDAETEVEE